VKICEIRGKLLCPILSFRSRGFGREITLEIPFSKIANLCRVSCVISPFGRNDKKNFASLRLCEIKKYKAYKKIRLNPCFRDSESASSACHFVNYFNLDFRIDLFTRYNPIKVTATPMTIDCVSGSPKIKKARTIATIGFI
jgi:hypothetical protein